MNKIATTNPAINTDAIDFEVKQRGIGHLTIGKTHQGRVSLVPVLTQKKLMVSEVVSGRISPYGEDQWINPLKR